ncbi:MAG: DNA polymerase I [bacterium JZ-2024 1]
MAKFLLIDGPSLMFRAFYVLPPMRTASGEPTSALFGFLRMVLRANHDTCADGIAVALDIGKPFREDLYEDYKATRQATPEDLAPQLERLPEVLQALDIPALGREGLEADDLIATLAQRLAQEGHRVVILTGDRDLLQILGERIEVLLTRRGVTEVARYDVATFERDFGFAPSLLPDYKALAGDPSDNIAGVPGIGDKTARMLVGRYGSLENIFEHLQELKTGLRDKLEAHRARAFEGRLLAKLCTSVEGELPAPRPPDLTRETARSVLHTLEFDSLIAQYGNRGPSSRGGLFGESVHSRKNEWDLVWEAVLFGAKSEPSGGAEFQGWHAFWDPGRSTPPDCKRRCILLRGNMILSTDGLHWTGLNLSNSGVTEVARTITMWSSASPGSHIFVDDWKAIYSALTDTQDNLHPGFQPTNDLSLSAFLLDPEGPKSLKDILKRYLPDAPLGRPTELARALSKLDEVLTNLLKEAGMLGVLEKWEIPLAEVLARMEKAGIRVSSERLEELSRSLENEVKQLEETAEQILGKRINLSSPKQVAGVLFEELGLPQISGVSTSAEVLEQLRGRHPIVDVVFRHRTVSKLRSTYCEGLQSQIGADGKVHTTYLQTGTATGRLSSREPNLQNIPVQGPEAVSIRRAFIPSDETREFLAADYSQIDLRLLAHLSGDEELTAVFRSGGDIHSETARRLFGISGEVSPEARRRAKAVNFGIVYLMSDYGLSQELGCPREEAGEIIRGYFQRFPGVKRFIEDTLAQARATGYVTTLLGRRRWVQAVTSENQTIRKAAERAAVNTRVQGSTADLLMMAMVELDRRIPADRAIPLLQIHDEVVFEVPSRHLESVAKSVKLVMETVTSLRVPLVVQLRRGRNLGDLEGLDEEDLK